MADRSRDVEEVLARHGGDHRAAEVFCWAQREKHGVQTDVGDMWGKLAGAVANDQVREWRERPSSSRKISAFGVAEPAS